MNKGQAVSGCPKKAFSWRRLCVDEIGEIIQLSFAGAMVKSLYFYQDMVRREAA
ncbi:hypothetical protein GCWU000324_00121 [Kingella oralis ATCC 51147]|uniref:Uncharacterized protein n=1 Tax=Kingella oralis ATCC 51147 TaxID=629741 RepID=C4GEN4_9NEIS|nr:hypothetical protein GCWU000324_00121 [Kingella oralis ATCC 51147]